MLNSLQRAHLREFSSRALRAAMMRLLISFSRVLAARGMLRAEKMMLAQEFCFINVHQPSSLRKKRKKPAFFLLLKQEKKAGMSFFSSSLGPQKNMPLRSFILGCVQPTAGLAR